MTVTAISPPVIEPGRIYKLDDFLQIVGWGRHAFRAARNNGLGVVRTAGRVYVRADDWLRYMDAIAESQG